MILSIAYPMRDDPICNLHGFYNIHGADKSGTIHEVEIPSDTNTLPPYHDHDDKNDDIRCDSHRIRCAASSC